MPLTLYAATIPSFLQILGSVAHLVDKAEAFGSEHALAPEALIEARLGANKVADVAKLVGYSNKSQFSRDYKAYFHESPTDTLRSAFG